MNARRLPIGLVLLFLAIPLSAGNITFANAGVKALCVANWDTSGDGELSEEEAAAVTSLGSVFREKTSIGAFPELRYFTGLTAIGDSAFYRSSISGELRVPGNVNTIGDYAFNGCRSLTSVVLEEGVDTVGWHSFSGPISKLSLPASLKYIYSMAINPYVSAASSNIYAPEGDLYVYSQSPTPPSVNAFAFFYVFGDGHLVVPHGSKAAYMASEPWSQFYEYLEVGDVNDDGRMDITDVTALIAYVTGQDPNPFKPAAADINGDGVLDGKDVERLCQYLLGL